MTDETPAAPAPATESRLGRRLPAWLRAHLELLRLDRMTIVVSIVAAAVLTISRYHANTGEYSRLNVGAIARSGGLFAAPFVALHLTGLARFVSHATLPVGEYLYWFYGSLVLFLVVPVAALKVARLPLSDLGFGLGDWRYGLKATALLYAVMLPFVVGASFTPTFANSYPMSAGASASLSTLVVYELGYVSYFAGWEFVYRGLVCNGLYPRIGAAAIFLSAIPFAVMHGGKPEPEAYGAIVAAIALGAMAVRARSFWYGALLHASVAFTMDMLALAQTHRFPTRF